MRLSTNFPDAYDCVPAEDCVLAPPYRPLASLGNSSIAYQREIVAVEVYQLSRKAFPSRAKHLDVAANEDFQRVGAKRLQRRAETMRFAGTGMVMLARSPGS